MFSWNSCFFDDSTDVGNLISGSSACFKSILNIWKYNVLLKPGLENFEHYFASVWDERNCMVVWTFFSTAFPCDWSENWPFPVLWPLLSFPNLLAYWVFHIADRKTPSCRGVDMENFGNREECLSCVHMYKCVCWGQHARSLKDPQK